MSVLRATTIWVRDHPATAVFVLALAVRAVIAAVVFVRTGGTLFADDAHYAEMTADAARGRTADFDEFTDRLFHDTWAYTFPLTAVRWATAGSVLAGQLLVAAIGAATAALTVRLAREAVSANWALAAGVLVAVVPSQALWSSLMLKDAAVWLAGVTVALLVAVASRERDERRLAVLALLLAVLLALWGLRFHSFVIACWALVPAFLVIPHRDRLLRAGGALGVAVLLPGLLGLGPGGIDLVRSRSLSHWRALNAIDAETAVVDPVITPAAAEEQAAEADASAAAATTGAAQASSEAGALVEQADDLHARVAQIRAEAERAAAAAATEVEAEQIRRDAEVEVAALLQEAERLENEARARTAVAEQLRLQAEELAARARDLETKGEAASATDDPVIDSAFGEGELEQGAESDLKYLPRGLALMLLRPYPWIATTNANLRLAAMEHVLWYPLLLSALTAAPALWRRRRVLAVPLLVGGGSLLAAALTEGNFGTAYRHRSELVWVLAVLAAVGLHDLFGARRRPPVSAEDDGAGLYPRQAARARTGGLRDEVVTW